ncbi:hypothetical protein D9615_007677 [Tricholomella constricta]|uniref:DNA breaking-rejoining enzyme n=1 Tax=Tricholomella constricta TaxID=117010 RepID=A0A8H5H393_9AGAR|nr:hypothetical protein D9615_007677 [Tricholomella constricta]
MAGLTFGICPAPGIFGLVADAIVWIFLHKGVDALLKWVDDFIFFRYRRGSLLDGSPLYGYDESLIWNIAEDLGWPWAREKFVPFATSFTYIGFLWSLADKTVSLPAVKRTKYLDKLSSWDLGALISLRDVESVIGTLNHVTLVVPHGRSHLPALYRFRASFPASSPPWVRHRVTPTLANAWMPSTKSRYAHAVSQFLDFCSSRDIAPWECLPAPEALLCSFAASFAGKLSGSTIRNKCSALRSWHIQNNAHWFGGTQLNYVLKGAENMRPIHSRVAPRCAVTKPMLDALTGDLNTTSPFDACMLFVASACFWGQICLGELLPVAEKRFAPGSLPTWSDFRVPNENGSRMLHLPRTKCGGVLGEDVMLTRQQECDPISALRLHRALNGGDPLSPLAAYIASDGTRRFMTKHAFLRRCRSILAEKGFPLISGHSFRIGGTTHLLLSGVPPDIVRIMGRWSSDSFLRYWRSLDVIAPLYAEFLVPLLNGDGGRQRPSS